MLIFLKLIIHFSQSSYIYKTTSEYLTLKFILVYRGTKIYGGGVPVSTQCMISSGNKRGKFRGSLKKGEELSERLMKNMQIL